MCSARISSSLTRNHTDILESKTFVKTLAEELEKQTPFSVIWGFLRPSGADVLVWQDCGMVRVIIIILHAVGEHSMAACPHAPVGTVTVVERMEQVATDWEIFAGANCCFKGQEINTGHGQNRQLTKELDSGRRGGRGPTPAADVRVGTTAATTSLNWTRLIQRKSATIKIKHRLKKKKKKEVKKSMLVYAGAQVSPSQ